MSTIQFISKVQFYKHSVTSPKLILTSREYDSHQSGGSQMFPDTASMPVGSLNCMALNRVGTGKNIVFGTFRLLACIPSERY